MIFKPLGIGFFLAEAAKLQRIVSARWTHIVGDEIIMGNDVALVGMIPQPAHILNQLTRMGDQCIVDGNNAPRRIARGRLPLQPGQALPIQLLGIPRGLIQPTIETGLIRRLDKFGVNRRDILALGHQQTRQVFAKMTPLRRVGKHPTPSVNRFFNHRGKADNGRHGIQSETGGGE